MRSPELEQIIALLREARAQRPPAAMTLAERRESLDMLGQMFPMPGEVSVEQANAGGVPAYWLASPGADESRTVLYLHGGSYNAGSLQSHGEFAARVGRAAGARVLFPEYRLSPEHRFPAAVEDATALWRWLTGPGGADPGATVICGDSAGGGLTLATCLALRDAGDPLPAALALVSAWTDLTCTSPSWEERMDADPVLDGELRKRAQEYLDGADPRTALASPLFADLSGMPPTLIQVGTDEILYDDSVSLAERMRAEGVEVELDVGDGLIHAWPLVASAPEAQAAGERIGAYLSGRVPV
jgi:monoterpene epsilon-lactone hydrolase